MVRASLSVRVTLVEAPLGLQRPLGASKVRMSLSRPDGPRANGPRKLHLPETVKSYFMSHVPTVLRWGPAGQKLRSGLTALGQVGPKCPLARAGQKLFYTPPLYLAPLRSCGPKRVDLLNKLFIVNKFGKNDLFMQTPIPRGSIAILCVGALRASVGPLRAFKVDLLNKV